MEDLQKKDNEKTPEMKAYEKTMKEYTINRPILKNCLLAFFVGGTICLIGQMLQSFFMRNFNFTEQTAGDPTVAVLIFITMLITGFGFYDKIAQFSGAGTAVPITGFGNAVISAAIEHRSEGLVLGTGGNMFKLAGSVIMFGVFAAFVISVIKTFLIQFGVI
ncbi:stage V sporulation protein AC [Bacillus solimangrovi]|uniref:Stage V sporulation protein AC n=1 Tax=Bacillus solimangrovi TaxID=1305675 RepID=A0A1E5LCD6_9BACI|nr:stage V sporulation protein AC [Bacillus solimangrovi]OEH91659.1 stage V sporulation protein AC [Bacillus solimangrovi]